MLFELNFNILATMLFTIQQMRKRLSAGAILVAQLATCLLAPWFHQHPGHDHAEIKGSSYHSHASEFDSPPLEGVEDHHDLPEALHILKGSRLFDGSQASNEIHFGQIVFLGKFSPKIDFFGLPSVSISPPTFVFKTPLKLPPVQPAQDYFVLIATGLSPPLA